MKAKHPLCLCRILFAEGENINKLEKADILELTVKHLHRITRPRDAAEDVHRFQAGFSHCASEACGFLLSLPGLDADVGRRLVAHLGQCLTSPLSVQVPPRSRSFSPPISPQDPPEDLAPRLSSTPSVQDLSRPLDGLLMVSPSGESHEREEEVWRPW
ncbi:enhancer of split mgamma protein-like [Macrosteles quadrilineatus]|uniref:enhancer of split mgamma protein-like n=1 Tax=Macrosteles quadrilineatus TaxID=74068 RepID=UPI0023E0B184|nr:enhancer of split mgamma protein-like [Macrosteles quadrilineatus]